MPLQKTATSEFLNGSIGTGEMLQAEARSDCVNGEGSVKSFAGPTFCSRTVSSQIRCATRVKSSPATEAHGPVSPDSVVH